MMKQGLTITLLMLLFSFVFQCTKSQQPPDDKKDTFFLAKKNGLLGKLGKSISIETPGTQPVKIANPFLPFAGTTINSIEIVRLGFDRDINDPNVVKHSFGLSIANA